MQTRITSQPSFDGKVYYSVEIKLHCYGWTPVKSLLSKEKAETVERWLHEDKED